MTRRIRIGIDTGGTFTDVVAVDEDSGELATTKVPSTPADPAVGFMHAVDAILRQCGLSDTEAVTAVNHGTTVATNRLLEGKVADLGFITTTGYRHMLEIARQSVPDGYGNSYFWVKPERIVPVHRVREVGGRLGPDGAELRPFDEDSAVAAARFFRERGITTIGVCLLHSYANPEHEQRMLEVLTREHPAAVVSLSSQVLREYREYERAMTTLVDAAVKPSVRDYVARLADQLDRLASGRQGEPVPFAVMKSNGGIASAAQVARQPITTVLSGPAAGALGAATVAMRSGRRHVVALDGGGTSTDVTVVQAGQPAVTTEGRVGVYPVKIPMIDVVTVGAGGGSIAWVSPEGTLKVGPQSAGADPGPLCYGRGGTQPTVTDAHLVLGRIPPHLLGGQIPLDEAAARQGIAALGERLGLGVEATAGGILEVSAWNQANALRQVTVQRGLDLREFTLVAFGGSGPLLAARLADLLDLPAVLIPPDPGNLSAYGLLAVDVRIDFVRTAVARHDTLDLDLLAGRYDELTRDADQALAEEGFPAGRRQFERTADLRYRGQAYEVRVPVPDGPVTDQLVDQVAYAFHDAHRQVYGYDLRDQPAQHVEWVNLRVTGVGTIHKPAPPQLAPGVGAAQAHRGRRPVWFDRQTMADHYARASLGAGDVVVGPAVIEEFGSTIPVPPGFTACPDEHANLILTRTSTQQSPVATPASVAAQAPVATQAGGSQ